MKLITFIKIVTFPIKAINERPVRYYFDVNADNEENDKDSKSKNNEIVNPNEAVNPENNTMTYNHNEAIDKQNIGQPNQQIFSYRIQTYKSVQIDN